MSVTLKHAGLPDGATRWELLSVFEATAKPHFRLSRTAIALFRHHVLKTCDQDYKQGRICAVWSQVHHVARALGLCPRSINAAERELAAAGFVIRTSGINGARSGQRESGNVVWAAGINLAPAIGRYSELCAHAEAIRLRNHAVDRCKAEIRAVGQAIRESGDEALRVQSHQILPDGRTARISQIERLQEILAALTAALAAFTDLHRAQKNSDASEGIRAPIIQQENIQKPCSARSAKPARALQITPRLSMALATPAYRDTLAMIGEPTWPNIIQASSWIAPTIGIDQRTWKSACEQFGREQAALCVIIIDRNAGLKPGDPYHARKPANCLAGMVRKARVEPVNFDGLIMAMLSRGQP